MNITEDYVSFETAKLLKEKGFDEPTTKSYYTEGFENPMIFSHDLLPCIRPKENSTFECIKFKPIVKELPKTWEEYCKTHPKRKGECWINELSKIVDVSKFENFNRDCIRDRNILPNEEYAKAMLALCQLIQLRDYYNDGWIPDWTKVYDKHVIYTMKDQIYRGVNAEICRILAFKTEELCNEFLNNFRDLIEIAKPLL